MAKQQSNNASEHAEAMLPEIVPKRKTNPGVRVIGGRIYDSELGKTCHQCRQKTLDFTATCKNQKGNRLCTIKFCHKCLLNRYGEKAVEMEQLNDWMCPKCRLICNCSLCMKKKGYKPTGILVIKAKACGFSSVFAMLNVKGLENNIPHTDMHENDHVEKLSPAKKDFELSKKHKKRGKENHLDEDNVSTANKCTNSALRVSKKKKAGISLQNKTDRRGSELGMVPDLNPSSNEHDGMLPSSVTNDGYRDHKKKPKKSSHTLIPVLSDKKMLDNSLETHGLIHSKKKKKLEKSSQNPTSIDSKNKKVDNSAQIPTNICSNNKKLENSLEPSVSRDSTYQKLKNALQNPHPRVSEKMKVEDPSKTPASRVSKKKLEISCPTPTPIDSNNKNPDNSSQNHVQQDSKKKKGLEKSSQTPTPTDSNNQKLENSLEASAPRHSINEKLESSLPNPRPKDSKKKLKDSSQTFAIRESKKKKLEGSCEAPTSMDSMNKLDNSSQTHGPGDSKKKKIEKSSQAPTPVDSNNQKLENSFQPSALLDYMDQKLEGSLPNLDPRGSKKKPEDSSQVIAPRLSKKKKLKCSSSTPIDKHSTELHMVVENEKSLPDAGVVLHSSVTNADLIDAKKDLEYKLLSQIENMRVELREIAGIELATEDVGNALQFVEFCSTFGELLKLSKGQPECMLREMMNDRGRRAKRAQYSAVAELCSQLLSMMHEDSDEEKTNWKNTLQKYISESLSAPKELISKFGGRSNGYDILSSSEKLKLLNFLCDEALTTMEVRSWIDTQNENFIASKRDAKEKVVAARQKEKNVKQKLQTKLVQDGFAVPEREDISEIRKEADKAHAELVEALKAEVLKKHTSDAVRSDSMIFDGNGRLFWKLKAYSATDILLQELKNWECGDSAVASEGWFVYSSEQKDKVESYIALLRGERARVKKEACVSTNNLNCKRNIISSLHPS